MRPAVGRIDSISPLKTRFSIPLLDFVIELVAVRAEELDPIILVRIVRSAEHDACIRPQRARDIGDAGSRQRPDEQHVGAERHDTRGERILQHVAGKARVFANDDRRAAIRTAGSHARLSKNMRCGSPELERRLCGDGLDICRSAHSICAENLPFFQGSRFAFRRGFRVAVIF
jgi:hypothetical protein